MASVENEDLAQTVETGAVVYLHSGFIGVVRWIGIIFFSTTFFTALII